MLKVWIDMSPIINAPSDTRAQKHLYPVLAHRLTHMHKNIPIQYNRDTALEMSSMRYIHIYIYHWLNPKRGLFFFFSKGKNPLSPERTDPLLYEALRSFLPLFHRLIHRETLKIHALLKSLLDALLLFIFFSYWWIWDNYWFNLASQSLHRVHHSGPLTIPQDKIWRD